MKYKCNPQIRTEINDKTITFFFSSNKLSFNLAYLMWKAFAKDKRLNCKCFGQANKENIITRIVINNINDTEFKTIKIWE